MPMSECEVSIIGAGPYGLAVAAHLRAAKIETRVFGRAMEFWKNNMPTGMLLRSSWDASHISDPSGMLTLDHYHDWLGMHPATRLSLDRFVNYGLWFQKQVVSDLDERQVLQVEPSKGGFRLLLEDDEVFSRRVVVATGIGAFAHRPSAFEHLPPTLASHSSDHRDLKQFVGKEMIVVGGGQSAVESAVLLSENGANVELVVRAPQLRWLSFREFLVHSRNPFRSLLYPPTDVGPPGLNQIVARPDCFKLMPRGLQSKVAYRCIRPAASGWLKPRATNIRITTGGTVVSAVPVGEQVALTLSDGGQRRVDHVLLATGYRVDVTRYTFLALKLRAAIRCMNGYPELAAGFESSVPGLHFVGAPAASSFGPLMRFVSGTNYTARALTHHVVREARTTAYLGGPKWLPADVGGNG